MLKVNDKVTEWFYTKCEDKVILFHRGYLIRSLMKVLREMKAKIIIGKNELCERK